MPVRRQPKRQPTPAEPDLPLADRLARLDKTELSDALVQLSERDAGARRHLERLLNRPSGPDLPYYRRWFVSALGRRPWIPWREAPAYSRDVNGAIDAIAALLKAGFAGEVIVLAEYALRRLETRLLHLDDSNGIMAPFFPRLEALHLAACTAAPPPPRILARRLFEWELTGEWDTFRGAIAKYAPILGAEGMATYRMLVDEAWRGLPALPRDRRMIDHQRWRVASMRQSLAKTTGNPVDIIEAWHDALDSAHAFVTLVEALHDAGARDEAIVWAEAGVSEYPEREGNGLRTLLSRIFRESGRDDDALQLLRQNLAVSPQADAYAALAHLSRELGVWDDGRSRAIDVLRAGARGDQSQLVMALMAEGDHETAWRELIAGGADGRTMHQLVRIRAVEHAADAVPVYWQLIEATLVPTGRDAYRQAVLLLKEVQPIMAKIGEEVGFFERIATLRERHRLRRTLLEMLTEAGW